MALHVFNLGAKWGWVNTTPRLLYPWERNTVPILQEAGWAPGPILMSVENLIPTGTIQPVVSCYTKYAILAHGYNI